MNKFGFPDTPYTPGDVSLVLEKIWSKIKQCVNAYIGKQLSLPAGLKPAKMWCKGKRPSMFGQTEGDNYSAYSWNYLPEQQMFEYLQNSLQLSSNISIKRSSLPNLQDNVRQVNPA